MAKNKTEKRGDGSVSATCSRCPYEIAHNGGDAGLNHVIEGMLRHLRQAHNLKAARP
jgi:hypothetical protein